MMSFFRRFGFAGAVLVLVVALGMALALKGLAERSQKGSPQQPATAQGGKSAQKGAPQGARGGGGGPGGGQAPRVVTDEVGAKQFYDLLEAIGTAQARESVTITSKVTDVIRTIRVDSGDRVARGQVLVEMASVEQSADLEEAKAAAVAAQRQYERFAQLGERGFAPAARVEAERAAFERAQARVEALQSRISDRMIRAPFAGVVGLRTASPGALVRPGDAITTLDDISLIKLDFDIAESQLRDVGVGAFIAARTAAFPDREFTGSVKDIDSRVNAQTRTIRVRAEIPNRDGLLKPGMLMTVQVRSNPRDTLAVPEMALIDRSDGSFVFVVQARGDSPPVALLSEVKTGARQNGLVEIRSGLEPGSRIIVEGVQRARTGQPVREEQPDGLRPAQGPDLPPVKKAS